MQALRQILDVKGHSLNIILPDDFNAEKVEVIILPIEVKSANGKRIGNLRGRLDLTTDQYKDFQRDVKDSREGWERNI